VEPELYEKYVKDGTLRLEWKDFPYQGRESVDAALAARAAQAQGKFWEYHDLIYANQSSGNSGGYSEESLTALAEEAGLDVDRSGGIWRAPATRPRSRPISRRGRGSA
jgi:protein-disulfide isomerase